VGAKGLDRPLLAVDEALLKDPRLFPKQFRKVNSQKFAGTEFSEIGCLRVTLKQQRLYPIGGCVALRSGL
jgi:hypothetical protein